MTINFTKIILFFLLPLTINIESNNIHFNFFPTAEAKRIRRFFPVQKETCNYYQSGRVYLCLNSRGVRRIHRVRRSRSQKKWDSIILKKWGYELYDAKSSYKKRAALESKNGPKKPKKKKYKDAKEICKYLNEFYKMYKDLRSLGVYSSAASLSKIKGGQAAKRIATQHTHCPGYKEDKKHTLRQKALAKRIVKDYLQKRSKISRGYAELWEKTRANKKRIIENNKPDCVVSGGGTCSSYEDPSSVETYQ